MFQSNIHFLMSIKVYIVFIQEIWVQIYVYFWVHVYAFWVHVYGSVGCMYAVVGCKPAATFGCKVCGSWVQVSYG